MFKCRLCQEKDQQIRFLKDLNKDLWDRLMAFNKEAFTIYNAETKKGEPLYPKGIDETGNQIDYSKVDLKNLEDETFRAFGEEPITVEDEK